MQHKLRLMLLMTMFLLLNVSLLSTTNVFAAIEGDYEYVEVDGEITITNYKGSATDIVIPNEIANLPVTVIGNDAFKEKGLTNVSIPNSVTTIGTAAFSFNDLTSVTIPNNITTIAYETFYKNNITSVTIPSNVTTIETRAFSGAGLTSVIIQNGVVTIREQPFSNNKLTSLTLPNSVTTIGRDAFAYNDLTNIDIPNGVTTIEDYAFMKNKLTSVVIPSSVTRLENAVFMWNQLTQATVMNSETVFGANVFLNNPGNFILIGYNPSTAKEYANQYSYKFKEISNTGCYETIDDNPSLLTGTGTIDLTVLNDDKKTTITQSLQVKITDKSCRVFTSDNDQVTNGKFTSIDKLPKGTYYVTITDGKI